METKQQTRIIFAAGLIINNEIRIARNMIFEEESEAKKFTGDFREIDNQDLDSKIDGFTIVRLTVKNVSDDWLSVKIGAQYVQLKFSGCGLPEFKEKTPEFWTLPSQR